jgi:hypothetical protein
MHLVKRAVMGMWKHASKSKCMLLRERNWA